MFPFDPPEYIRKLKVFWCFQGDQKGTLGSKGLKRIPTTGPFLGDLQIFFWPLVDTCEQLKLK